MDKQSIQNAAGSILGMCRGLCVPGDELWDKKIELIVKELEKIVDQASGFKSDAVLLAEQDARHYGCSWIRVNANGSMTHYHAEDVFAVDEKPAAGGQVTAEGLQGRWSVSVTNPETVRPANISDAIMSTVLDSVRNSEALAEFAKSAEAARRAEIQDVAHDVLLAALQPGGLLHKVVTK